MKKEIKRAFILLPAALIVNTGIGILNFSLVFYMRDIFNSTAAEIGWFSSFWAFSYFIGCFVLHNFSRKIGAHRSIAAAALAMAVIVISMSFAKTTVHMFVLYSLFGFITALFWPPLMGWLSEGFEGTALNRMMGFFNLSWSTGLVISPYLAGLLLESNIGFPLTFTAVLYSFLTIVLFLIPVLFSSIIMHEEKSKNTISIKDSSTPFRYIAWLGNFSGYIIFGVIMFVFPLYAREVLLFTESSIGLLLLFRALFSTFVFIFVGKISWWHFNKIYMLILQFFMIVLTLFIPCTKSWIASAAVLSAFGILFAAQYSSSIFHGVSGSIHREKRMVIHESVLTAGVVFGAVGGGEIYQHWGMAVTFNSAAAAVAFILIFQIVIILFQG